MPSERQRVIPKNIVNMAIISVVAALIVIAVVFIVVFSNSAVAESLVIEAGAPFPPAGAFLTAEGKSASYGKDYSTIGTNVPGTYPVLITLNGKNYASELVIKDTAAPQAIAVNAAVWTNSPVLERDFVSEISDTTKVALSFEKKPDTSVPGTVEVTVILTDEGKNTARVNARLSVYQIAEKVDIPLNTGKDAINAASFVKNVNEIDKNLFVLESGLGNADFSKPGAYEITVKLNGEARNSLLHIVDVTPPAAVPAAVSKFLGEDIAPEEFVDSITDETEVTASFLAAPDMEMEGIQNVTVVLTDAYGNKTEIESTLTLEKDSSLPVIAGELDKTVFVGDTISYRTGVTAADSKGRALTLDIDSSGVNTKIAGTYTAIYSATSSSGKTTAVTGTVTVYESTRGQVDEMADNVLDEIIKDDMTLYQKAQAIYEWVQRKMSYVNGTYKGKVENGAYRAFKYGEGDCFTYYAVSEVLLARAGIDNMGVKRISGTPATHYWSLVNVGDGWYHFDTTPHKMGGSGFMITESRAQELANQRSKHYYDFDKTLNDYPEVVQ